MLAGLKSRWTMAFLMRVLDSLADRNEQLEPLSRRELGLVAELHQRQAVDQFHHEERLTAGRQAAVEHTGDVGMIHHRQGLPFLLEPRQHRPGIHAGLDQLQRDFAIDRFGLLGDPDLAHSAFADLLLEHVAPGNQDVEPGRRSILVRDRSRRR